MDMTIEIPSGKVRLCGRTVYNLHRKKPYVLVGENKRYLTAEECSLAKEMRKAFKPLIGGTK